MLETQVVFVFHKELGLGHIGTGKARRPRELVLPGRVLKIRNARIDGSRRIQHRPAIVRGKECQRRIVKGLKVGVSCVEFDRKGDILMVCWDLRGRR